MIRVGPSIETPEPPTPGAPASASSWLKMNCSIALRPPPPYWAGQLGGRPSDVPPSAACQSTAAASSTGSSDLRSFSQARSGMALRAARSR